MIKGIIFDYGGTLDSRGDHWSEVIYDKYLAAGVPVSYGQFAPAYVHAERELARVRHILPCDTFADVMRKKIRLQMDYLEAEGLLPHAGLYDLADTVATMCYEHARTCVHQAAGILSELAACYPMVLVSNFYGNVDTVVRDFGIRQYFKGIIESAVVGIRKPDPRIFALGCTVLDLPAEEVLVVGDSMSKDIIPARQLGCATAIIAGRPWRADTSPMPDNATTLPALRDMLLHNPNS